MKTPEQIKELNYNNIAFFNNISTTEAKRFVALKIYTAKQLENMNNFNKKGVPKISLKDTVKKREVDKPIKSNSILDGKSSIDHIIKTYNRGVGNSKLRELYEKILSSVKFGSKLSILNDILNNDEMRKLQEIYIYNHCFREVFIPKGVVKFIKNNDWCLPYLISNNVCPEFITEELNK